MREELVNYIQFGDSWGTSLLTFEFQIRYLIRYIYVYIFIFKFDIALYISTEDKYIQQYVYRVMQYHRDTLNSTPHLSHLEK